MKKKDKEKLLKNYETLFSLYQEVALSNFFDGMSTMSIKSEEDHNRKIKAENNFIKTFVEIKSMLEEL